MSSDTDRTSSQHKAVTPKIFNVQHTKKPPYSATTTAMERYPDILRGDPKSRMLLFDNTHEPRPVCSSRPTRQQFITLLDRYIADGKVIRLTSIPIPKHSNEVTVTFGDTLEDHNVEKDDISARLTIGIWTITGSMRIKRVLFGQFREIYIFSLNRVVSIQHILWFRSVSAWHGL